MAETTCLVFYPNEKEFLDLVHYITDIEIKYPNIGICKIIPPFSPYHNNNYNNSINDIKTNDDKNDIVDTSNNYNSDNILSNHNNNINTCTSSSSSTSSFIKDEYSFIEDIKIPINIPIKQHIEGRIGIYHLYNLISHSMKVKQFYDYAKKNEKIYNNHNNNNNNTANITANNNEIERQFWRSLGKGNEAIYGADIEGTLFTNKDHWNLDLILHSDILRLLDYQIPGVNCNMLYFGSWKAMFAYHVEDYDLYSINYLHTGNNKLLLILYIN